MGNNVEKLNDKQDEQMEIDTKHLEGSDGGGGKAARWSELAARSGRQMRIWWTRRKGGSASGGSLYQLLRGQRRSRISSLGMIFV